MALGTYVGAGGVKELKSCYVGAGGVKTVNEIYVGQNGSVRKVWPSYTDYGDTCDLLAKSYVNAYLKYSNGGSVSGGISGNGIHSTYATTGVNTSTYYIGDNSKVGTTISSSNPNACHFFYTTALDTRGYSYICVRCLCNTSSSNSSTYRARPFVSYVSPSATVSSSWTNNLAQYSSSSDLSIYGRSSTSDISSYGFYVLFDISKMQQESAVICFGARLANNGSSSGSYGGLYIDNCTLCKEKPSTSVSATVTWG